MEYSVEFIKYITKYGKLEIIKQNKSYIAKCSNLQIKAANIETALMLLVIKIKHQK